MSSPMLGLRTAIYKVTNLSEAKARYSDVFQATPYFDEPFYVWFNIGGYELWLQPDETLANAKVESVNVLWWVESVHREYDRIIGLWAISIQSPMNVGGGIIVASLRDPWGNVLGLIYNPEFSLA